MKNCIGFDIGNHAVHVAVVKRGVVTEGVTARLATDLVKNGTITSYEAMTDFLKEFRRVNNLSCRNAALILPAPLCYTRRFFVAANNRDQLLFNLPYGFRDFITDDKSNYFFDCAVLGGVQNDEARPPELDVLAAAARKDVIEDYMTMFRKAGFKLRTVIPQEFAYMNLLRNADSKHRHGILDIGHNSVRLYFYDGFTFEGLRVTDYGCNALDEVITGHFGVDAYMAATYRENNLNGANAIEDCRAVYGAIALEVLKAINFYRFNGGGTLEHLHCCGGGSRNEVLMEALRNTLPIKLTDMSEFFTNKSQKAIDYPLIANAAGAALQ